MLATIPSRISIKSSSSKRINFISGITKSITIASSNTGAHEQVWRNSQGIIGKYAVKPINMVTLSYLLSLEKGILSEWCLFTTTIDLKAAAMYAHTELPIRLARRVRAIERLPFIVGVNPHISSIYELYRDSFHALINLPPPDSDEEQEHFTAVLSELVESHQTVIPNLAKGFKECGKYMSLENKQDFLDKFVSARIGIRVIAEHYLALQNPRPNWIGVVNTKSSPGLLLESICKYVQTLCELNYGSYPDFEITGYTSTKFAYIPVHMEYIFMELIKNAMRATVEQSEKLGRYDHPPIEICIGKPEDDVVIRFRDQGGGIANIDQDRVWEYSFTTVAKDDEMAITRMNMQQSTGGPIAGLGFGLPMSRVYAKYFGGSLEFRSVSGYGTDVFLQFPSLLSEASFGKVKD